MEQRRGGEQGRDGVAAGGWQPVVYGQRYHNMKEGNRSVGSGLFTIFVDNLPQSMNPKELYSLFMKFGVVKDVFIPSKTRKTTRSRFGFVRFDCPVTVEVAIQKANGLWCDDKSLQVKKAEFEKPQGKLKDNSYIWKKREGSSKANDGQVILGVEAGNGWLYNSIIVRLKSYLDLADFKNSIYERGSKETMSGNVGFIWIKRIMWLSCYGVPLNLWNTDTFLKIGRVWGEMINMDEETTKSLWFRYGRIKIAMKMMSSINAVIHIKCGDTFYPIRVCEEQVVVTKLIGKAYNCDVYQ
ncbi:hypothetical protein ACSBR1_024446 [Camellia fascicularis]